MIKVAINGFGRIGRAALKVALEYDDIDVVAINDLGDIDNLAYLLKYDSIYGRYAQAVSHDAKGLIVGSRHIPIFQAKEPATLPWKDLNVDVVIESTGVFTERERAALHLAAGAKRVIISAPTKSTDVVTVVKSVNDAGLQGADIVSNASCTTNCVSPVTAIIEETCGIEAAVMTTVHAYTATQAIVDGPVKKDWRRGRAAGLNIVPSSTGAADAVTATLPQLAGKFDGVSLRIPVPVVSLSDITCVVKRATSVEDLNQAFRTAATGRYEGIVAVTDEPVVSSDFIGDPHSAIIDLPLTRVVGGTLVKVMAWYDNEWGYANRLVEQVRALPTH